MVKLWHRFYVWAFVNMLFMCKPNTGFHLVQLTPVTVHFSCVLFYKLKSFLSVSIELNKCGCFSKVILLELRHSHLAQNATAELCKAVLRPAHVISCTLLIKGCITFCLQKYLISPLHRFSIFQKILKWCKDT